ncbi:MAG TPA: phosphopyruvate hydratase, partial [Nevskiaceae bacterium]|nr:phosphopyruvate hydratase [Nevskiaceae bacterium]
GRAAVPAGASTGSREARELRDGGSRYGGRGVRAAARHVVATVAPALQGVDAGDQRGLDRQLVKLDGTPDKSRLGANTLLGVSMAVARAAAQAAHRPLFAHLAQFSGASATELPVPMFNVLNGGVHADNNVDCQEFMIAPVGAPTFAEAVRYAAETYHALKALLKKRDLSTGVGDEGGFAPQLTANEQAIELIVEAIASAGFQPGKDIVLALDPASSEFHENGAYAFSKSGNGHKSSAEMIAMYRDWIERYPIWSLEDGLAEDDWDGWQALRQALGQRVQLVGDDIFCTNPAIIQRGITADMANAALIKLNQIGTVSETLDAIAVTHDAGWTTVISHRSGETPDDFIADLAVATHAGQIKSGAPARGERLAKYNQLLRIEEELGAGATYAGSRFSGCRGFRAAP